MAGERSEARGARVREPRSARPAFGGRHRAGQRRCHEDIDVAEEGTCQATPPVTTRIAHEAETADGAAGENRRPGTALEAPNPEPGGVLGHPCARSRGHVERHARVETR